MKKIHPQKTMTLRVLSLFSILLLSFSIPGFSKTNLFNRVGDIHKGPLKISAIETTAKNKGRTIEAKGDVAVKYNMESGDILTSFSQFAHYDEIRDVGKIWGNPKAVWIQKDPNQPKTNLKAKTITLKLKQSELIAKGKVNVVQASSTLKAEEVIFYNEEKKMTANGGRPHFVIKQDQHHTEIRAQSITAWTDKRQIHFTERVRGKVKLMSNSKKKFKK